MYGPLKSQCTQNPPKISQYLPGKTEKPLAATRKVVEIWEKDPHIPRMETYISYALSFDPKKLEIIRKKYQNCFHTFNPLHFIAMHSKFIKNRSKSTIKLKCPQRPIGRSWRHATKTHTFWPSRPTFHFNFSCCQWSCSLFRVDKSQ